MREIKFREWDGKKFHYWGLGAKFDKVFTGKINPSYPDSQFTGLLDKQGVEIYEGDIGLYGQVDDVPLYAKVVYDDRLASYCFTWDDNGEFDLCGMCDLDGSIPSDWFEVIGNIYEHPHLLGETK